MLVLSLFRQRLQSGRGNAAGTRSRKAAAFQTPNRDVSGTAQASRAQRDQQSKILVSTQRPALPH